MCHFPCKWYFISHIKIHHVFLPNCNISLPSWPNLCCIAALPFPFLLFWSNKKAERCNLMRENCVASGSLHRSLLFDVEYMYMYTFLFVLYTYWKYIFTSFVLCARRMQFNLLSYDWIISDFICIWDECNINEVRSDNKTISIEIRFDELN